MNEPETTKQQTTADGRDSWTMPPFADRRTRRAYWRAQRHAARWSQPDYRPGLVFGALMVLAGGAALLSQIVGFNEDLIWATGMLGLGLLVLARAFSR